MAATVAVMVAEPAATGVTTPLLLTVAFAGALLVHEMAPELPSLLTSGVEEVPPPTVRVVEV